MQETHKIVRISYADPFATDSDSDCATNQVRLVNGEKRRVLEIKFLLPNPTEKTEKKKSCVLRGVRRMKSGKYGAEIRDPVQKKKVWLGTFNTAEEASFAYKKKKLEFENRTRQIEEEEFMYRMELEEPILQLLESPKLWRSITMELKLGEIEDNYEYRENLETFSGFDMGCLWGEDCNEVEVMVAWLEGFNLKFNAIRESKLGLV